MYIPLSGFSARLSSSICAEGAFFPVADATRKQLLELLDYDDYTHVLIEDGNAREVVKLTNYCGMLIMYRGRMGTKQLPFPCGAKITYLITPHTIEQITCSLQDCEKNTMPYSAAVAFSVNTTAKLDAIDTDLPIADDKLALLLLALPEGHHTFLSVCDNFSTEIIKATNSYGRIVIERGQELTEAHTFPLGSVVEHVLTPSAIRDIVCQMECCP